MRSSNFFRKPETALQRAHEFISVGKERDALQALHDMIKDRRHRVWTKTHEQIMMKHVELCVSLRNSAYAKDALFQYKALTQQINVKSLESVLTHFLTLAERRTEDAQQASIEKVEEIDDLDQADAPENLLLSLVSGAVTQDRMDRAVLSPWLRFLWDSYRNCIDLLRNNAMVETLYHHIARQSFKFCARYQRRTEFRKLCDILRLHLTQIQKTQHLSHVVKLSSLDSLTIMQETRLIQLDTAIQMELWKEAYRSAEDLHGMMQLSKDKDKRMVKPTSYVNYYDKLALVFWKGGNSLFHAAALLQKFIIYKDMKKSFSEEEAADQATRVLLATLSIPDGSDSPSDLTKHLDIEEQHIANVRVLSNLIRLPIAPTRVGILKECVRLGIPDIAAVPARKLYNYFEREFAPLRLATSVDEQLKTLEAAGQDDYVGALRHVIATKSLKQLSAIYDCLSLQRIRKIIPFFTPMELERFLVDIAKHRFVKAHIDHREACVRFTAPENASGTDGAQGVETIRTHLEDIFVQLRDTTNILDAETGKRVKLAKAKLDRQAEIYHHTKDQDYERMLNRRRRIENNKETTELQRMQRAQRAQQEAARIEEQRRREEVARLEIEAKENEKKRRLAEQQEVERRIRQEKMKQIQSNPIYQSIVKEKGEEALKDMDPEAVLREQRDRLDAERREQQSKQQVQEKKFDHMVRAYHLEEMKIRKAQSDERAATLPTIFDAYEERRIRTQVEDHEQAVDNYNRLKIVRDDALAFIETIKQENAEKFAQRVQDWQEYVDRKRREILNKRHEERKQKRREEYEKKKAFEQQLLQDEENRIRRQQMSGRTDRIREPLPDTKADQDSDWRRGMSSRPAPAPAPAPVRVPREPMERAPMRERTLPERPPPVATASDVDTSWRKGAAPAAPARENIRPPVGEDRMFRREDMKPRAPPADTKADEDLSWRRAKPRAPPVAAPQPAASGTADGGDWQPVGRAPPADTKADEDLSWRRAKPRAPAAAPAASGEADSGDWQTVGPRQPTQPAEPAARKAYRPPGSGDRKPIERKAYVPPGSARPPVNPSVRRTNAPGAGNAGADDDGNWRRKK
ncbi:hypothetical protein QR680_011649 [Steinernema hermaphroditum]|uniref:Eukaryotic translation initiation factor 3 subunit A n=1 Tax=Steinernema hermaphroditum TaxID=289476 RepID=A0AA39I1I5_9BILA|nr:hypothetical protein QR680_011649 [Steinernema hermaphroditum]